MRSPKIRIVIAGSTGMIGGQIKQYLERQDYEVHSPTRHELMAEIRRIEPEYVLNCIGAGMDYRKNQSESEIWTANYEVPMQLVRLAQELDCKFITIGTLLEKVKGFDSPYIDSKRAFSEFLLTSSEIRPNFSLLQAPIVFGIKPEHALLSEILESSQKHKSVQLESPYAIRDFIHILDLSRVIEHLIKDKNAGSRVFEVGSGKGYLLSGLCENALRDIVNPAWKFLNSKRTNVFEVIADLTTLESEFNFKVECELESWLASEIATLEVEGI